MPILRLPYPPSVNRMWRNYGGRVVKSAEARDYQHAVQVAATAAGIEPLDGRIAWDLTIHPRQPKKPTGARVRCMDVSNALKIAEDALNGIAWIDDSQVDAIAARRGPPIEGGALVIRWGEIDG